MSTLTINAPQAGQRLAPSPGRRSNLQRSTALAGKRSDATRNSSNEARARLLANYKGETNTPKPAVVNG